MSIASISSIGCFASSTTIAVISLVSDAIGVTSSAALAYSGRCAAVSYTTALADARRSLAGSGASPPACAAATEPSQDNCRKNESVSERFVTLILQFSRSRVISTRGASTLSITRQFNHDLRRLRNSPPRPPSTPARRRQQRRRPRAQSPSPESSRRAIRYASLLLQPPHPRVRAVASSNATCVPRSTIRPGRARGSRRRRRSSTAGARSSASCGCARSRAARPGSPSPIANRARTSLRRRSGCAGP